MKYFKDIIIILLLALAIILILGILLYSYLPTNKIIPEKVSYTTPETVSNELNDNDSSDDPLTVPYSVTASDLTNYKVTQQYVPGKKNPFAPANANTENTTPNGTASNSTNTSTSGSNSGSSGGQSTETNSSTNTEGGYLPNRGTK